MRLPLMSAKTIQPESQFVDPLQRPDDEAGQTTTSVPAMAEWRTASSKLVASLARTEPAFAAALACDQAGMATASKIAADTMTTKASINVNPFTGWCIAVSRSGMTAMLSDLFMRSSRPSHGSRVGKPRICSHYRWLHSAIAYSPTGQ